MVAPQRAPVRRRRRNRPPNLPNGGRFRARTIWWSCWGKASQGGPIGWPLRPWRSLNCRQRNCFAPILAAVGQLRWAAGACRKYAADRGWTVVGAEREEQSGYHRHRPGLVRFRSMIRAGLADVLLAYDPDRLSRNKRLTRELADECDDHGVDLDFVTETYDATLEGDLRRDIDGYVAEKEREKFRERTNRARRARVEGVKGEPGKPLPGRRPIYGYDWGDDKKSHFVENDRTARIVRRIFREFVAGRSLNGIAARLTGEGIPTPSGRSAVWRKPTIRVILRQPAYVGEYRALRYEQTEGTGVRSDKRGRPVKWMVRRSEEETILLPNVAPALVDRVTWDATQTRLRDLGAFAARPLTREEEALLRGGFAVCAHCGGPMVCTTHHGKLVYRCGRRLRKDTACPSVSVRAEVLDRLVWLRIRRFLYDPSIVQRSVERLRRDDPTEGDIARLDKLIAGHEERRRNLLQGIQTAKHPGAVEALVAQLESVTADVEGWQADKKDLRAQRAGWEAVASGIDDLYDRIMRRQTARDWVVGDPEEFDYATRRAWMGWLGVQVRVKRTIPDRRRKGLPRPERLDAAWAANQPYEVVARIPLDGLPLFAHGGVSDSSASGSGSCPDGRRRGGSGSRSR